MEIGEQMGWEVIFWNHTPFNLEKLGYKEIKLEGRANAKTDLLKRAKIEAELNYFSRKFKDPVYQTYKFANSHQNLKAKILFVCIDISCLSKTEVDSALGNRY